MKYIEIVIEGIENTGAMHWSWWVILRFINDYDFNVTMIMNKFDHYIELIEYFDKE